VPSFPCDSHGDIRPLALPVLAARVRIGKRREPVLVAGKGGVKTARVWRDQMKKLAAIVLATTLATNALAGGLAPVVIEEPIMVEEDRASFPFWLIPIIIVGILVLIPHDECDPQTE
jgi:hypothetical protein